MSVPISETPRTAGFTVRDRSVVVLGLGASGRAAAALLQSLGASVLAAEDHPSVGSQDWARQTLGRPPVAPAAEMLRDAALVVLSPGIPTTHALVRQARTAGVPCVMISCRLTATLR